MTTRERMRRATRRSWLLVGATIAVFTAFVAIPRSPISASSARAVEAAAPMPERLSETGLYAADGTIDPRNRIYEPQYPLWTDGADKARWIRLPDGMPIDTSDLDAWKFPAGTTVWKEFAWAGHKVETRMIRIEEDGSPTYATYVWNEEQTDAVLAPAQGVPAAYEFAPGKRHSIPGLIDCQSCHASAPSPLLGFTALQLSDDRDPLAPHARPLPNGAVTLNALIGEGRLAPAQLELLENPPRIRTIDPLARAAQGYLSANCGSCHNTRGPLARLGFSFLYEVACKDTCIEPATATAVAARGRFAIPGVAPDEARIIAPGHPEFSAVVYRLKSRRPISQMPPLGTVVVDSVAADLLSQWVGGMEPTVVAARERTGKSSR